MGTPLRCIAIMGATATGKSALAVELARALRGEVISMDSRQVYRGFDVGTGKLTHEERAGVAHHLIDVADPHETWSAGKHAALARRAAEQIAARGRLPILAGGTGLYFRGLFAGLVDVAIPGEDLARIRATFAGREPAALHERLLTVDPARARDLSPNDRVRITRALELFDYTGVPASELYARQAGGGGEVDYLKLVLFRARPRARARIAERTRALFASGWPDEVRRLLAAGVSRAVPAMNGLGYRAIADALAAGRDPVTCLERVIQETQRYAKRQETFFRGERDAVWIDVDGADWERDVAARVNRFLAGNAKLNNDLTRNG